VLKKILIVFCALNLVGCASLYGTFAEDENGKSKIKFDSKVYIGTKTDGAALILAPMCAGSHSHPCTGDTWIYLLIWPLALIDLPLSFIADTLLLPYTLTTGKPKELPKEKTVDVPMKQAVSKSPTIEESCFAKAQQLSAQEYCACLGMVLDTDTKACFQGNKEILRKLSN
jgi:uncharacterized protein YceK